MNARIYPNRELWLASRDALSIGASEAAQALGVSPYGGPWELYERKQGKAQPDSAPMARGRKWEARVLEDYAEAAAVQIVNAAAYLARMDEPGERIATLSHREFPWLRCSPDAFSRQNGVIGGVEAKTSTDPGAWTPEAGTIIEAWSDDFATMIPAHYAIQCYVSLEISGLPFWDLCALVPAGGWLEVRWVRIMRDVPTQSAIVATLAEWQEKHLIKGIPPEIDGSGACNRALSASFQKRPARESTYPEMVMMQELASIKGAIKRLEQREDQLKNELIHAANGSRLEFLGPKGPYGQPQHNQGRSTVDMDRLKTEFPTAFETCQKQGQPFTTFNLYKFGEK